MIRRTETPVVLLLAVAALAVVAACSDGSSDMLSSGSSGQLTVLLHDDGMPGFTAATVTISALSAVAADGTLIPLDGLLPIEVDLLTLQNGTTIEIAADVLPAGEYTDLVLTISGAHLVTDEGATITIDLPPGGVTRTVPASFVIVEGEATTITLDFRVDLSFECDDDGCELDPEIIVDGDDEAQDEPVEPDDPAEDESADGA